jgi:hypothetical protein
VDLKPRNLTLGLRKSRPARRQRMNENFHRGGLFRMT